MNHKFEPNVDSRQIYQNICARVKSHFSGSGHPTFNRESSYWVYKPYYGVDDHLPLYGNNGSLDPSTYKSYEGLLSAEVFFQAFFPSNEM